MYLIVKYGHLTFVAFTFILFNLRVGLRQAMPAKPLPKLLRILPHLNDTLLLITGLWLIHLTRWIPFVNANWLGVKLIFLVLYVLWGALALRIAPRSKRGLFAYGMAMCCFAAIVLLAWFKPLLW